MSDRTKWRRWTLLSVALFALLAIWAVANPMFASPDETVHMVRAQGFANLDFSNPYRTDGIPIGEVDCFRFEPDTTAECMVLTWPTAPVEIDARSTDGYPPLLHVVAAVPAVAVDGLGGAYAMRVWMAAVVAALLGWAAMLLSRPGMGPWPLVALVASLTPQVVFISSSVNPSGLTAASAAVLAAALVSFVTPYRHAPEVRAAVIVGVLGLVLTRRDGVLMLAALVAAMAPLVWFGSAATVRDAVRKGLGRSAALLVGLVVGVIAVAAVVLRSWGGYAIDYLRNPGRRYRSADIAEAVGSVPGYLYELVGVFGWRDTPIGPLFVAIGVIIVVVLLVLVVTVAPRRLAVATLWAFMVMTAVIVVSGMIEFTYLQARYLFPVWIAAMVTAGVAIDAGRPARSISAMLTPVVLGLWAVLQFGAFFVNQRRYSVGLNQVWSPSAATRWDPPLLSNSVAMVAMIAAVVLAVWVITTVANQGRHRSEGDDRSTMSAGRRSSVQRDGVDPDRAQPKRSVFGALR